MKVLIVGGGIAGLAAGTYARQCGFETTVFEMHSIPGGNSTSWKRKGYLFEGGMHWLVGSGNAAPLHRLWLEVGALKENNPIYNKDPFLTYMDKDQPICLYRNPAKLQEHLLAVSPGDGEAINAMIKDIRALGKLSMPVMNIQGVQLKQKQAPPLSMMLSMIGALPRMKKLNKISAGEYAGRFKHPGLRTLLSSVVGNENFSASSIAFTLGGLSVGDAGYPAGGSLRMAQNMADTFTSLGGSILYQQRVTRVEVQKGAARGVWVGDTLHKGDAVIVTADTLTAASHLFEQPLMEPWAEEMRQDITPLNCTFISIGVKADLSCLPESMLFPLHQPFDYGGMKHHTIGLYNYAKFDGYAPKDCTALTCFLGGDTYDQWKAAKADGSYYAKKEALANTIIDRISEAIPETAGKAEVWDVATPLTYERYCGTYRGSWMSVLKPNCKRQQFPIKPETIKHLYFAGQRIMLPGGLPSALSTGRQAVQYLCKDTQTVFQCQT